MPELYTKLYKFRTFNLSEGKFNLRARYTEYVNTYVQFCYFSRASPYIYAFHIARINIWNWKWKY